MISILKPFDTSLVSQKQMLLHRKIIIDWMGLHFLLKLSYKKPTMQTILSLKNIVR